MNILLIGGSKSGKSHLAQELCRALSGPMIYWATMEPTDEEDRERIRRHLLDRDGWGFETLEAARDLPAAFDRLPPRARRDRPDARARMRYGRGACRRAAHRP